MHRRSFFVGVAAAAAVPAIARAQSLDPNAGAVVTMRGYLKRITNHYYVLAPTAQKTDPNSTNYAAWPTDCVRVYPKNTKTMVLGLVTVTGRIFRGKHQDAFSKTVATVVMTEAVMG